MRAEARAEVFPDEACFPQAIDAKGWVVQTHFAALCRAGQNFRNAAGIIPGENREARGQRLGAGMSDWTFFRRVLMVGAFAAFALMIWQLSHVVLLVFGTVLIGLLLSGGADAIASRTGLPRGLALTIVVLLLIGAVAAVGALFGSQIGAQVGDLWQRLPGAVQTLEQRFELGDLSGRIMQEMQSNTGNIFWQITSVAGTLLSIAGLTVLLLVGSIFIAAQPSIYRDGALTLVPPNQRPQIKETMDFAAAALRQWLGGQLISVLMVGALTAAGLWIIGLPSPLALGLIAGIAEFIPYAGPIIGAIPALLLAMTQSWTVTLYVLGLFLVVQQLESNMITPLVQRSMVSIPPVLTLFAIVSFGVLFGPLGVVFGAPLTVLIFVAVNRLYVRGLLDEPTTIPGEKAVREAERQQKA